MSDCVPEPRTPESQPVEARATARPTNSPVPNSQPADSRFGVIHLLVWTAASALYLGIERNFWWTPESIENTPPLHAVVIGLSSMSGGAGIGGVILLLARRARGRAFPVHPGEWLLVALGLRIVLDVPSAFTSSLSFVPPPGILHELFGCLVFLGLATRVQCELRWRALFWSVVAIDAWQLTFRSLPTDWTASMPVARFALLLNLDPVLPAVSMVALAFADVREEIRKPWMHWAGILAVLWDGLLSAICLVILSAAD